MSFDMRREAATGLRQSGVIAGGQNDECAAPPVTCGVIGEASTRRFLNDHMDIGAADACGIDTRDARPLAARPGFELRIDEKRAVLRDRVSDWGF